MSYIYCPGRHPMVHTDPPSCNLNPNSPDCMRIDTIPAGADKCTICFLKALREVRKHSVEGGSGGG